MKSVSSKCHKSDYHAPVGHAFMARDRFHRRSPCTCMAACVWIFPRNTNIVRLPSAASVAVCFDCQRYGTFLIASDIKFSVSKQSYCVTRLFAHDDLGCHSLVYFKLRKFITYIYEVTIRSRAVMQAISTN